MSKKKKKKKQRYSPPTVAIKPQQQSAAPAETKPAPPRASSTKNEVVTLPVLPQRPVETPPKAVAPEPIKNFLPPLGQGEEAPPKIEAPSKRRRAAVKPCTWATWLLSFAFILVLELMLRLFIYSEPWQPEDLGYIALFSLAYATASRLIFGLLPRRLGYTFTVVWSLVIMALFLIQYVYFLFFKTPVLAFSIVNGAQVTEFSSEVENMVSSHLPQCLSFIVVTVLFIWRLRYRICRLTLKNWSVTLAALALCLAGAYAALPLSGTSSTSAYTVFYNDNNPQQSQEQLGMLTGFTLDAARTIWGFSPKDELVIANLPADEGVPAAVEQPVHYEPNTLDIDFASLIAGETDSELLAMHQYFSAVSPSKQNEYTGIYEGCNLIFITAEGFSHYLLDEELFPTLNRLATEGFEFTNMYTPIWNVSTSDGEYVAMTGLYPKSGVWSFSRSANIWLPFCFGEQFTAAGYPQPLAYHNHSYSYYDRDLSHPAMGYDFRAPEHGLEMTIQWPESDLEMVQNSVADYLGVNSPFYVYYMTVSGHLEYNFSGNNMAVLHQEEVAELPYSEPVQAYIACNLELENMLAYLLEQLELAGELENTVIVLSADHYPYGLDKESIDELAGHPVEENFELYRNGLIIWKYGQEHQVIDEPVASIDIIPTVSNLFGLPFDSRLLMGRDIFAENTLPLVIFNNRSWITDQARYNSVTGEVEGDVSSAYVDAVNSIVSAKLTYSAKILESDYYTVVLGE